MGGGSAPKPDPNIGIAALKSAEVGEDYLAFMRNQADITNQWAQEDRARYTETFRPIEDRLIQEAERAKTPEVIGAKVDQAQADARFAAASGQAQQERRLRSMGVRPDSGRYDDSTRRAETAEALAVAGAGNIARRQAEAEGDAKLAAVANVGRGFAVNPAQSMSISNGGMASGVNAAMQGYGQQGSLLQRDHDSRMASWQADQDRAAGIFGAIGRVAGAAFFSDKDMKTEKEDAPGVLEAIREMPVEKWRYKDGTGQDQDNHIGPYAQDFAKATGTGDGKTIKVQDAIGVTMGAVKELDKNVQKIGEAIGLRFDKNTIQGTAEEIVA